MSQAKAQHRRIFRTSPHQQGQHTEAKRGVLANPGSLIVAAFGLTFVGYVFNVGGMATSIDAYLGGLNHSVQSHNSQVSSIFLRTLPLLGAGLIVLILIAVLRALGPSSRSLAQTEAREVSGVEAFVNAAGDLSVSKKVARTAYKQLLPYVRKGKHLSVKDTLCKDLKVRTDQVSHVYGTLLRHTDRRRKQGDDGRQLRSVLELMLAVEASEDKSAPKATVLAFKTPGASPVPAEAAVAAVAEAPAVAAAEPVEAKSKPKKPGAVLVHPARLARRELSMIRSRHRAARKA